MQGNGTEVEESWGTASNQYSIVRKGEDAMWTAAGQRLRYSLPAKWLTHQQHHHLRECI